MNAGLEKTLRRAGRLALNLLYPPLCMACRTQVSDPGALCSTCWQKVRFLDGPMCGCCGLAFEIDPGSETLCAACHARPPAFDKARAVMRYDEHSRGPILALKHADRLEHIPAFGRWLERNGKDLIAESDVILPVPLHP